MYSSISLEDSIANLILGVQDHTICPESLSYACEYAFRRFCIS